MEELQWSALAVDAGWKLTWVTRELREFLAADDAELGIGRHILDSFTLPAWQTSDQALPSLDYFVKILGYSKSDVVGRGLEAHDVIDSPFADLVEAAEPLPYPYVDIGSFDYKDPRLSPETPSLTVNLCMAPVREADGTLAGGVVIFFMGVRPNILSLLGRGDQQMYERMARLVEPARHRAAILFCDLADSGSLSRELSNSAYFKLIRALWTGIDRVIADHSGIIGKHAGDGASAYFLVTDLGSTEATAAAALKAARAIHSASEEVFSEIEAPGRMKVGVHWAGSLYMGQLVPGGRLEVTALGDEVNETSRIESCARPGETLVSKHLLQQLDPDSAAVLGVDLEKVRFAELKDREGASQKAIRDAGSVPVTEL